MAVVVVLAFLLQQFAQFPVHNAFTRSLSNFMHVPMFVVITTAVMWLRPQQPLWLTLLIVGGLALLSEALQLFSSRQASVADLLLDAVGITIAVNLLKPARPRWLAAILVTAVATLSLPSVFLAAYATQHLHFPTLFSADVRATRVLTSIEAGADASHSYTREHNWSAYAGQPVLAVTWGNTRWPGIHIAEPVSHWHSYQRLRVEVFNAESSAQPLTVGVRHRGFEGTARYFPMNMQPGHNRLQVELTRLANQRDGTPAAITHLMLYTTRPYAGQRILLGRVWLE